MTAPEALSPGGRDSAVPCNDTGSRIPVLYIAGYTRSGTTLLDRMLGQLDGFFSSGEVRLLWERGVLGNELCGCKETFHQCPFWSEVMDKTCGGMNADVASEVVRLESWLHEHRRFPALVIPQLRDREYLENARLYTEHLGRLYGAIARTSGNIVVDSSKHRRYAALLAEMPGIDLHTVQMVRDSRAVAFSWQREKIRPEVHWQTEYMDRYGALRTSVEWNLRNLVQALLPADRSKQVHIRYEDLVADPPSVLSRIRRLVPNSPSTEIPFTSEGGGYLRTNHTVAGNPSRFRTGEIHLRVDDEWRTEMSSRDKLAVTAMTWPLLMRHGYLPRRGARARDPDQER